MAAPDEPEWPGRPEWPERTGQTGRRVYLDHNATAPLRPEARAELLEVLDELGGNPSSLHARGRWARHRLDEARERVAAAFAVHEDEIVFTSGGTEANNLALLGTVRRAGPGAGLVTTAAEHSAVLEPARQLEREGHPLAVLAVDEEAHLDPGAVVRACREHPFTALVSVAGANNEVGTCLPLAAIGAALDELEPRPRLHSDLVQALGRIPFQLREWGVDLASFAAHKVGGPVGVGVLYRRRGIDLQPLMFGGSQEAGLRPGTESVAAWCAAARAIELAVAERALLAERLRVLERTLWEGIVHATDVDTHLSEPRNACDAPRARLLGPPLGSERRLPGTLNVLLEGVDGKVLVMRLDLAGIEASAGSACASGSLEPSHVLRAMGLEDDAARSGLRLSLGRTTTHDDVVRAVESMRKTLGGDRAT